MFNLDPDDYLEKYLLICIYTKVNMHIYVSLLSQLGGPETDTLIAASIPSAHILLSFLYNSVIEI